MTAIGSQVKPTSSAIYMKDWGADGVYVGFDEIEERAKEGVRIRIPHLVEPTMICLKHISRYYRDKGWDWGHEFDDCNGPFPSLWEALDDARAFYLRRAADLKIEQEEQEER